VFLHARCFGEEEKGSGLLGVTHSPVRARILQVSLPSNGVSVSDYPPVVNQILKAVGYYTTGDCDSYG
jgi:hypothetical protein